MAMAKTDGSGPEQFRIHSSIVSKLLAFPVHPPNMKSLQLPSLVSK
jgi:hypothetical protein